MRTETTDKIYSTSPFPTFRFTTVLACLAAIAAPDVARAQSRSGYGSFFNPYSSSFWDSTFFWPAPPDRAYRRTMPAPQRRDARPKPNPAPVVKPAAGVVSVPFPAPSTPRAAKTETASAAQGPLIAIVSLANQRLTLYGPNGELADTRVSTGKPGYTTPTGVFSVLQRNRFHQSNIYSNAPMPYMQRLTWSGIALHEGVVPGYPASHGCIRLPNAFATRLWSMGRIGMRVVVAPGDVQPGTIEDSRLPSPLMTPSEVAATQPILQTVAAAAPVAPALPEASPLAVAKAKRGQSLADKAAAEREVKTTAALAAERSAAANKIGERLRAATVRLAALEEDLDDRLREFARVQTEEAEARIAAASAELRQRVEAAKAEVADLKASEIAASDAAFDAAKTARAARERLDAASDVVDSMRTALEPVSIFVSRKEGKVFVRQGFRDIHQEPIEITDAGRPLGTHVFTAMSDMDNGAKLNWMVVTVPSRERGDGAGSGTGQPASTPSQALGRFTLPEATLQLVRERLWSGASLIVSDSGLGPETGTGTDFVVLTR